MITTVTLNTSVDKAYQVKEVKPGTVSRVLKCSNTAGGKGLNVAKVIKLCGEPVKATGFVGGYNGAYIEAMLKQQEVPSQFVKIKGESRSCINILAEDGSVTEFLEPGVPVEAAEMETFLEEFAALAAESEVITISGSAPQGVPTTIYQTLIQIAGEQGKKVILDTSGEYLKAGVKARPYMIKPNSDEIEQLLGTAAPDKESIISAAIQLHQTGIPVVAVSLGGEGVLTASAEGVYQARPPRLEVINTVGCGDSMIAAFAVGIARNYPIKDLLRYAVSISAANALTLETGSFKTTDMEQIQPQVEIQKLKNI